MKSHHVLFLCSLFVLSWGIISALGHESDYNEANLRYLIYTVNSGEGFNLRRDVHMRAATLVNELRKKENWILVLPPWPHLYHWKSRFFQSDIKWERFFDVASLNEYVPSIEFEEYLAREGRVIDEVCVCVCVCVCVISRKEFVMCVCAHECERAFVANLPGDH